MSGQDRQAGGFFDTFPSGGLASFIMGTQDICLAAVALGTGTGVYFVLCCGSSVRRSSILVSVDCSLDGLASRYLDWKSTSLPIVFTLRYQADFDVQRVVRRKQALEPAYECEERRDRILARYWTGRNVLSRS
jgi:hypothetical protein